MARFDRLASGAAVGILALMLIVPFSRESTPVKTHHVQAVRVEASEPQAVTLTKAVLPRVDSIYLYAPDSSTQYSRSSVTGDVGVTGVPEPSTWALMVLGLGGVGVSLRRRTAKPAA